jgi:hypothetical protein
MGKVTDILIVIIILALAWYFFLNDDPEEIITENKQSSAEYVFSDIAYKDNEEFTIVFLPDTQLYTEINPEIFTKQTQWIVDNKEQLNIKFVMHLGDIVQDLGAIDQWEYADESMSVLDDEIPYLIIPGNHDIDLDNENYGDFNNYFPVSRFDKHDWYGGHYPENGNENNYGFFTANNEEFMVIGLELCPNDEVLEWANNIVSENKNKKVIFFTHLYMYLDGTRLGKNDGLTCSRYPKCYDGRCNEGDQIWDKFVSKHDNIFLTGSGHSFGRSYRSDCVDGNLIHQTLQNYQYLDEGGQGYLRYYKINPAKNKIEAVTFSPYLNKFLHEESDEFTHDLEVNCVSKEIEEVIGPELPDIFISRFNFTTSPKGTRSIQAFLFNNGKSTAHNVTLSVSEKGKVIFTHKLQESMDVYTGKVVTLDFKKNLPPGTYVYLFEVDADNIIEELNETNNMAELTVNY